MSQCIDRQLLIEPPDLSLDARVNDVGVKRFDDEHHRNHEKQQSGWVADTDSDRKAINQSRPQP